MSPIAEIFAPGEFLRDELDARGWSQTELAEIMGRPVRLINEIIAGKKAITPETAVQLGDSLGTGPELWMNLESQYQLSRVRTPDRLIARRAALYERFPVREMIRRGWIEATRNVEVLEQQFRTFYDLADLDAPLRFGHAAKKAHAEAEATPLQLAWLVRARQVASGAPVANAYREETLRACLGDLAVRRRSPEATVEVAPLLAGCGVRLVVIEPIPGSKIDGACFWLDAAPVVALSLRLDRIDNFWFVLRHELEHVLRRHGRDSFILDQDLEGGTGERVSDEEAVANAAGAEFCVPRAALEPLLRLAPFIKEERVLLLARQLGVHPGLVVGQLQRQLRRYDLFRKHQAKIRPFVTETAPTDGWGLLPPIKSSHASPAASLRGGTQRLPPRHPGSVVMVKKESTGPKVTRTAAKTLSSPTASRTAKSLAGSALAQAGTSKTSSARTATTAAKALNDGRTRAATKALAGSVLTQKPGKRGK
jgi:HTH-type transcriptional regulator/antitoxin HigA